MAFLGEDYLHMWPVESFNERVLSAIGWLQSSVCLYMIYMIYFNTFTFQNGDLICWVSSTLGARAKCGFMEKKLKNNIEKKEIWDLPSLSPFCFLFFFNFFVFDFFGSGTQGRWAGTFTKTTPFPSVREWKESSPGMTNSTLFDTMGSEDLTFEAENQRSFWVVTA